ncbi:enoyl-CoA hydratase [Paramagnetospirillum magneticum]|uniref:Enoyl-CoA hydratase domain-containing protein 3, mitochondrial n=1 Tax=Paramagnetospirillum magneticum (strain ATCC 700264 / AMB-1) TaxID=342108 RepID=Q2W919_PARM1|nr:enoyl-CoA hydratase [Paramagnetospirillum magneticum]BAE49656.1 Enoyl-CoA hydratase/carnithine racemase [Paramagnetospirillum magneticum AMB-1]
MSELETILLRRDEAGVATLTLNRPEARNALSVALMSELDSELARIARDPAVRVVVLAANGPAFCAGHDLKEMRALQGRDEVAAVFALCSRVMTAIVRLPQPVIAKVHAMATAAGCQLVASCDLAYAATEAKFATPGVNIGLFCSTPMVALSRGVGRKQAMEMLLSGRPINAGTAERWGLVNHVVAAEALDSEVASMARLIASKSAHTLKVGKEAFYRQLEMGLDDAYALASKVMTENMLAMDAAEGIDAFLEKRPPVWRGC